MNIYPDSSFFMGYKGESIIKLITLQIINQKVFIYAFELLHLWLSPIYEYLSLAVSGEVWDLRRKNYKKANKRPPGVGGGVWDVLIGTF